MFLKCGTLNGSIIGRWRRVLFEWEEFKEAFLGKYFLFDRREVKVEEFINLMQGNMSVDKYTFEVLNVIYICFISCV